AGDLLQPAGDVQLQLLGLDHAGAGDEEEGLVEANLESAQFHGNTSGCGGPRRNAVRTGDGAGAPGRPAPAGPPGLRPWLPGAACPRPGARAPRARSRRTADGRCAAWTGTPGAPGRR